MSDLEIFGLVAAVVVFALSIAIAWRASSPLIVYRDKIRVVEKVPQHLERLARVMGIDGTERDSESLGRKVHDLIEERDARIRELEAERQKRRTDLADEAKAAAERAKTWTVFLHYPPKDPPCV